MLRIDPISRSDEELLEACREAGTTAEDVFRFLNMFESDDVATLAVEHGVGDDGLTYKDVSVHVGETRFTLGNGDEYRGSDGVFINYSKVLRQAQTMAFLLRKHSD